ncbi:CocE/NonD family hydrolase [Sphingosinicella rhizophila]|uniref:CocE/NonD family hydrolase n=1 Tax=Sphingosinicella rhizophila TaxID=3050082 RepID=A0ABU3Q6Y0_9SPHN|nr:CocE/NonD family hydrolase [Sphingosinicella sp. GR2756]MDT9598705.1 CocE/NonD family hydrolase [Sphingosinicella sp. GR2756]
MPKRLLFLVALVAALSAPASLPAQRTSGVEPVVRQGGDIPSRYSPAIQGSDFERREFMIPMRDGVKLYTVILVPKWAADTPIVMSRTPYNASARSARTTSKSMINALAREDEAFVRAGYIRVWQDVRGKYKSEGDYVVTRPMIGPLNRTNTDHGTDTYDTIEWLVNKANLPESNGRVGMIGSSYEGTTTVMALIKPHPALKVAVPESPLVDGWIGDDWFHNGAFRQHMANYIAEQTGDRGKARPPSRGGYDDYENFLRAGSAGAWGSAHGYDQLPFWRRLVDNPTYNHVWQGMALDKLLAANPSDIPTLWVQPLWDQDDIYGAIHSFEALRGKGKTGNNFLVLGPWSHSQLNREGRRLGPLEYDGETVQHYWRNIVLPFFNEHLKDGPPAGLPTVTAYNVGEDRWETHAAWPLACEKACPRPLTPIFLNGNGNLDFHAGAAGADSYVADPAKPVPHYPRPVNFDDGSWVAWLTHDQRSFDGRPDVMTYQTEVLKHPVRVSGAPIADIFARTTGTDGDFVVKVIDVYPPENATNPKMGGYQLPISLEIFRGRYRKSFEHPSPIPPGKVQQYKFRMPTVNHTFQPGHRIMIQIQSSLFPYYDRNPQTYVPNIFHAKSSDYQAATVTLMRGGANPSRVWLPIVPIDRSAEAAR